MESGVPCSIFHSNLYPTEKRIDAYCESISVVFDVDGIEKSNANSFVAKIETHLISDMMLVDCQTVAQKFLRPSTKIAKDGMDHFLVQVFLEGATTSHEKDKIVCGPSQLIVIDMSRPWTAYNPDFRNVTMVVPRRLLYGKLQDEDGHHGRVLNPKENPFAELLRSHILTLHRTIGSVEKECAHSLVSPSVDLVAAALNHASQIESGKRGDHCPSSAKALSLQIRKYIEENLGDPGLQVASIQKKFNLTRSTIYRLFPSSNGVMGYVRERRMKTAYNWLAMPRNPGESIAEIAFRLGFENETSFTRAFKNYFGVPPSEVKNERNVPYWKVDESPQRAWESWLRAL